MRKAFCLLLCAAMMLSVAGCGNKSKNTKPAEEPFDYGQLPFYKEDISTMAYSYDAADRARPFWLGNVIYNETVMVSEKNGVTEGRLAYPAQKVLAVYDWKLDVKYEEGIDYAVVGNKITLPEGSRIPVFKDSWAYGIDMPEGYTQISTSDVTGTNYFLFDGFDDNGNGIKVTYTEGSLIYQNYIHVSYAYDPAQFDYTTVPEFRNDLSGLTEKLEKGENINMVILGDSISQGCSASKTWGREPYCPFYGELVQKELERLYDSKVTLTNMSVGGKTSEWGVGIDKTDGGANNLGQLKALAPDFLIVGFGMNDFGGSVSTENFLENIDVIAESALSANPDCQIVFLSPFPPNPKFTAWRNYESARAAYRDAVSLRAAVFVDLFDLGKKFLEQKEYYEISASNINHPNDFVQRCYAMEILCAVVDYANIGE